ncbi:LAFA_0F00364g1_1 [Lachancea sp. 'fantastica']|nr:LAFA_0F00364g1_1 [Lachancea sp. 'fantastica']
MTLPKAKEFLNKLSTEARTRTPSPMKSLGSYFNRENLVFLAGGMPMADLFPWNEISAKSPLPRHGSTFESMKQLQDSDVCETMVRKTEGTVNGDIPLARSLQYGHTAGQPELVAFLKEHTKMYHDMQYSDWQLITSAGNTQSWEATLRVFCDKGDTILVEAHSFTTSLSAAQAQGVNIEHIALDDDGIVPGALEATLHNWDPSVPLPKLLYLIPTGQNPTGSTLGEARRREVYAIAQKYDLIIVEDEPYYFLQMDPFTRNRPERKDQSRMSHDEFRKSLIKSFISLDTDGRVVRLESFSKVLAPGTRLGWIVASQSLVERYIHFQEVAIQAPSGFTQTMVSGLLNRWGQEGYTNWLIALRTEYSNRRNAACDALYKYLPLGSTVKMTPPTAGMFFIVKADASQHPEFLSKYGGSGMEVEKMFFQKFINNGVILVPGFWFKKASVELGSKPNEKQSSEIFFRGTFAAVDLKALERGIKALAECLKLEFCV